METTTRIGAQNQNGDVVSCLVCVTPGLRGLGDLVRSFSFQDVGLAPFMAQHRAAIENGDAAAWRSSVDDSLYEAFAKAALVAVNRTESGGAALDAVVATVAGEDGSKLLVPVPDSRRAEPLRVHLDLGPYACDDGWRWGIRARVEGTTFYRLFAPDDFDEERLRCTARYANALLLPLDGLGAEDVVRDASRASVVVALEPPDPKQA